MNKTMKTVRIISLILSNIAIGVFGLTMFASQIAQEHSYAFDDLFGGATTEMLEISEADEDAIYYKSWYKNVADLLDGNDAVAAAAQAEGSVLLKNDNGALPLSKGDNVSLFGVGAYDPIYSMGGGATAVSPNSDRRQFFQDTFEDAGLKVNQELADWYNGNTQYFHVDSASDANGVVPGLRDAPWSAVKASGALPEAGSGDTAVFVFGRKGTETEDLPPYHARNKTEDYLKLTSTEKEVLQGLKEAKAGGIFSKVIVILNTCNSIQEDLPEIFKGYDVDSVLYIGTPGTAGLAGVAKLMTGESTPSGRLADMWYSARENNPSEPNYNTSKMEGTNDYAVFQEGVYIGYRYAETRYEDYVLSAPDAGEYDYGSQVSYPFGYGLSYASFSYSGLQVIAPEEQDGEYKVRVTVTNTSKEYAGKEVVQIYLQKPYTEYDVEHEIEKPSAELVGFAKTKKLQPGEPETVEIAVDANRYFADFDTYGKGTYILEAGSYYLTAARDSHDAVNNFLAYKGTTQAESGGRMDAAGEASLVHEIEIKQATQDQYRYRTNTGKAAERLFDHADPNRADPDPQEHVTFMSRNNWKGTVFSERTIVRATEKRSEGYASDANAAVKPDPTAEYPSYGIIPEEGHIPLIAMRLNEQGNKRAYDDPYWETFLDQLTWEETVLLLSKGFRGTEPLQSVSKPATVDPNGPLGFKWKFNEGSDTGFAVRTDDPDKNLYPTGYPSSNIIASSFNTQVAQAVGQAMGEDALWIGCAGVYGFGLNIHRTPYGGRNNEYFSDDAYLTGVIAGWMTEGIQSKGCYVYNKHFVLNEMEQNRYTYETWITEQAFRQQHLRAFEDAIRIGGAMNVMTSFNRIGSVHSSNDYNLLTAYLRGECGMTGFAVTDSYRMSAGHGIAGGVLAGNDLPDGGHYTAVFNPADGSITIPEGNEFYGMEPGTGYGHVAQAMRESVHRIMYTVVHSNAMNYYASGTRFIYHPAPWVSAFNTFKTVSTVFFAVSVSISAILLLWSAGEWMVRKVRDV